MSQGLVSCAACNNPVSVQAAACPQCGCPRTLVPGQSKLVPALVFGAFCVVGVVFFVAYVSAKSGEAASEPVVTKESPPSKPIVSSPPQRPIDRVLSAISLDDATTRAKPLMEDKYNALDQGTFMLAAWAAKSMKWIDIAVTKDETTFALTQKDPDEARGKRLCVSGSIIQIEVAKTDFGKFHEGLLASDAFNIYRFVTVKSSGTLVGGDRARICGVVTGKYDYSNSAGGTGHAVKLVGMFDLPENK